MSKPAERRRMTWGYVKPLCDLLLVLISFAGAYFVRYELQWIREVEEAYRVPFAVYLPSVILLMVLQVLVYWREGSYRPDANRSLADDLYRVVHSTLTGIATMIIIIFLATPGYYSRLIFGYTGVFILLAVGASRVIEHLIVVARFKRGRGVERLLVVGAGEMGRSVMRAVVARPELGYQIIGFVDDDPQKGQTDIGRFPALGTTDNLRDLIYAQRVDQVIITLPWMSHRKIALISRLCERCRVTVRVVPDLFQLTLSHVVVDSLDGIPLLGIREPSLHSWQVAAKRAMDFAMATVALVLLSPFLGVLALLIKLGSPGPVIFCQTRVGRGGKHFVCFKFRSMYADAEARLQTLREQNEASGPIFKMREDPRRTAIGRFLRRTSMDELPQLWNVIRGEMSIVGPRPAIPAEVAEYESWHLRRLEVWPGITGLWQVSGRSNVTFDEMVLLDIYYIENWSAILDVRILLKTIPTVLFGQGAF